MLPRKSTVDPNGPLASALETLERLNCREEVGEIKRLLVERLQFREEAASLRADLARVREEARLAADDARERVRVARQVLLNWRNLALIHKSREELDRIDEALARHPFLRATG